MLSYLAVGETVAHELLVQLISNEKKSDEMASTLSHETTEEHTSLTRDLQRRNEHYIATPCLCTRWLSLWPEVKNTTCWTAVVRSMKWQVRLQFISNWTWCKHRWLLSSWRQWLYDARASGASESFKLAEKPIAQKNAISTVGLVSLLWNKLA